MNSTTLNKQKQTVVTNELQRSFNATSKLASGLTKERVKNQTGLLKIGNGKCQLL
jgi:hypothetical protein